MVWFELVASNMRDKTLVFIIVNMAGVRFLIKMYQLIRSSWFCIRRSKFS